MFCPECGIRATDAQKFCTKCGTALATHRVPAPASSRPEQPRSSVEPPPLPTQVLQPALSASIAVGAPKPVYASFGRRVAAFVIDYFFVVFAIGFIAGFIGALRPHGDSSVLPLIMLVLLLLYKPGMEGSSLQATLGKMALGIKVTSLAGSRLNFLHATGRTFAQLLSAAILYVGFLMAGFTKRRQALHDLVAGTLVVRKDCTPEEIADAPSAPAGDDAVLVILVVFAGIALIGILAAIAIPAYQDYTIRAQVTEGLNAAEPYKVAVSEAALQGTSLSDVNSETLQVPTAVGSRYVASAKVDSGVIVITYGGAAHNGISGKDLLLIPGLSESGIVWTCGRKPLPAGAVPAVQKDLSAYTTVADKYLPMACKPTG